ncbi:MAG: hypothetical protein LBR98_00680 [Syntrophomonadaceae bacterium]|jgi:hypothetical protein|nr:hypothetical protein [Syntrophomonadaceae bacterium]
MNVEWKQGRGFAGTNAEQQKNKSQDPPSTKCRDSAYKGTPPYQQGAPAASYQQDGAQPGYEEKDPMLHEIRDLSGRIKKLEDNVKSYEDFLRQIGEAFRPLLRLDEKVDQLIKQFQEKFADISNISGEVSKLYVDINHLKAFADTVHNQYKEETKLAAQKTYLSPSLVKMARLFDEYLIYLNGIADDSAKKNFQHLFEEIREFLQENGVSELKTEVGTKFKPNSRQEKAGTTPTGKEELHGCVAESRNIGFFKGGEVFVRESVVVYQFAAETPMPCEGTDKDSAENTESKEEEI